MKQIAGLFNDCIETIRNEKHDNLEQTAIDWLRDARYQLMRSIEAEYEMLILSIPNCGAHFFWVAQVLQACRFHRESNSTAKLGS
jgi:hypothetical protein